MDDGHLAIDEILQHHAGLHECRSVGLFDRRVDLADIDQRVENAAIADVGLDLSPVRCVDLDIQFVDEGRNHGEFHLLTAAVVAGSRRLHQAGCGFQRDDGFRLLHLDDAGFQESGCHTDGVRAGARMRLVRLQDDEGRIRIGMLRRQQQVDRTDRRTTRLKAEEATKFLTLGISVQPVKLSGDRLTRNLRHAADRDLADLTFGMNIQKLDRALPSHLSNSSQT